jgi:excinuclease ABC subunit A
MELPEGTRMVLLAPLVRGRKGEYTKLFEEIAKEGFTRVRVDGETKELSSRRSCSTKNASTRSRWSSTGSSASRTSASGSTDSVETTLRLSSGIVTVLVEPGKTGSISSR